MSRNAQKFSDEEIQSALQKLDGWELKEGMKLHKVFKFKSFAQAIGWMASVAIEADKMDHHPNWSNVYNKVEVDLWTHVVDGLSENDVQLAQMMDELA